MSKRIMKYNPAFLTDEELLRSFAVRQTDFDTIIRIIRENTTNVNQHVLVIGPRGIGKTTLLLRIGLEARTAEDLKDKWYPLVFAEESYSICSVGEFWLEALFHLAQQTGDKKWGKIIDELNDEKNDKRLGERALAKLLDFADSQGKRLLLMVENFNMLFDDQVSEQDAWTFRHTLINEPRIMLLASATSRLDQVDNSGSAMYELFKQHDLKPLDKDECIAVWEAVTGQHLVDDRIRPIQILTGGNPRLLSIISSFGSKLSFQDLMGDLLNLVDDNTEYFKSHLDSLPTIERKAYLALAELWDPSPAKDIARLARLDVNKTSSLMARLVSRGAVKISEQGKRTKLYQTTERMYNIYYLMRKRGAPSERVKAVVNFMVSFYGQDELLHVTTRLAEEACGLPPELCKEHFLTFDAILKKIPSQDIKQKILFSMPKEFLDLSNDFFIKSGQYSDGELTTINSNGLKDNITKSADITSEINKLKNKLAKEPSDSTASKKLGLLLTTTGMYAEAESLFRKAIHNNQNDGKAWLYLARLLNKHLHRYEEAESAYHKVVECEDNLAEAWGQIGFILHEKRDLYIEAERAYNKGIEIEPDKAWLWGHLGKLLHEKLGKYQEAEQAYRKALELQPDGFGIAWISYHLGVLLSNHLNKYEDAEIELKKSLKNRPDSAVAWAQLGKLLFEKQNKYEEAEKAFRKAIELKPDYAWAWIQLGTLLSEIKKAYEEAEFAYKKSIEIDPDYTWSWTYLAMLLHDKLACFDEAEKAYLRAIEISSCNEIATYGLLRLLLKDKRDMDKGLALAVSFFENNSGSAARANEIAWSIYKYGDTFLSLEIAAKWMKQAIAINADDAHFQHTYACILCALNRGNEALEAASYFLRDINLASKQVDDTIELFAGLAAAGCCKQGLDMLVKSTISDKVEPLIVGIRLYLGEEVQVATEILEVAKDVRQRIQTMRDKIEEREAVQKTGKRARSRKA